MTLLRLGSESPEITRRENRRVSRPLPRQLHQGCADVGGLGLEGQARNLHPQAQVGFHEAPWSRFKEL